MYLTWNYEWPLEEVLEILFLCNMLKILARAIKKRLKTIIFLILVGSMYGFYQIKLEEFIVNYNTNKYKEETIKLLKLDESSESVKKILFYTPFFSKKDYAFGFGNKPFVQNSCPVTNCFTTNDRQLLSKFFNAGLWSFHLVDTQLGFYIARTVSSVGGQKQIPIDQL